MHARRIALGLALFPLATLCCGEDPARSVPPPYVEPSAAPAYWPMHAHDAQHTRRSATSVTTAPRIAWRRRFTDGLANVPNVTIDGDGRLLVTEGSSHHLFAPGGSELWSRCANPRIVGSAWAGPDRFFIATDAIAAVTLDAAETWRHPCSKPQVSVAFITTDDAGNAYYECHGESASIDGEGNPRWTFDPFIRSSFEPRAADAPLLVNDAIVHVGRDSAMWTAATSGATLGIVQLAPTRGTTSLHAIVVAERSEIWFLNLNGVRTRTDLGGKILDTLDTDVSLFQSARVDDGVVTAHGHGVTAWSLEGRSAWSWPLPLQDQRPIATDASGLVLTTSGHALLALREGELAWTLDLEVKANLDGIVIGRAGDIIVSTHDGEIVYVSGS